MAFGEQGDRLGPGQRGSFPRIEKVAVAPDHNGIQTPVAFAQAPCIHRVHIGAKGTAIELRSTNLDQVQQALLDAQAAGQGLHGDHGFHRFGRRAVVIQAGVHGAISCRRDVIFTVVAGSGA
ncbi:hypothetical protein D3C71_1305070 [compost metagenome]